MVTKQSSLEKPQQGVIKLNVCLANQESSSSVGLGVVARDDQGKVLQMWSATREGHYNPVVVNLDADKVALLLVQQNG